MSLKLGTGYEMKEMLVSFHLCIFQVQRSEESRQGEDKEKYQEKYKETQIAE